MAETETVTLAPTGDDLTTAASLLRAGRLVAFPTETVYGLGGDATDPGAVAAIFEAKNRPPVNPLIVHIDTVERAMGLAVFSDDAERLARTFWPGPLTLVLPLRPGHGLAPAISGGRSTVALRLPGGRVAQRLIAAADRPLAGPSANPSGRITATSAAHVLAHLGGRIAAVIDDGPCRIGVESTIVGFTPEAVLLRPGAMPGEEIAACLGYLPGLPSDSGTVTAPGQFASHYAPRAKVRLNVMTPDPGEHLLGFGPVISRFNLSESGDLREAATNLFHYLHALDDLGIDRIAVSPIPDVGLGRAINDRLRRAAAPRD